MPRVLLKCRHHKLVALSISTLQYHMKCMYNNLTAVTSWDVCVALFILILLYCVQLEYCAFSAHENHCQKKFSKVANKHSVWRFFFLQRYKSTYITYICILVFLRLILLVFLLRLTFVLWPVLSFDWYLLSTSGFSIYIHSHIHTHTHTEMTCPFVRVHAEGKTLTT